MRLRGLSKRFVYLYDFGDGWTHDVELLGPGTDQPGCVYGEGTCPPEDCGGPQGYAEIQAVLNERGLANINRAPSGYDAHLAWTASPGAAAYRIFWREAWGPDWQHELLVGNVTETTLPNTLIDDLVFGVAAVDAAGHESLVAPYISPPREATDVKTIP